MPESLPPRAMHYAQLRLSWEMQKTSDYTPVFWQEI